MRLTDDPDDFFGINRKHNLDLKEQANVKRENKWLWIVFLLSIVYFGVDPLFWQ